MPLHLELVMHDDRFTLRITPPDKDGMMCISLNDDSDDDGVYGGTIDVNAEEFLSSLTKLVEAAKIL